MAAFFRRWRILSHSLVIGALLEAARVCAFATGSVTLAWMPSTDPSVVGYNLYYGGASGVYTNTIQAGNATNTVVSGLVDGATYYFAATAYDSSGVESPFSNEASYVVPLAATNQPPTLNALGNLAINENAGVQTVNLGGITSGAANEIQTLTVTAVSSNPALIPAPTVGYASPNSTGTLTFIPANNASGTATITVTVNDGQTQNNIVTRTFTVTVNPVNQPPTLNALGNLTINENAGVQTVSLGGITSGAANEIQTLTVTAVSSNPALISNPAVSYASPNATGTLTFTPANNASGSATITVTVNDGQTQNNTISRTFTVTVNPVNQPPTLNALGNLAINENAGVQTVSLGGIASGAANEIQTLTVTAVSSNPALIPAPTVGYASPNSTGTLTFIPANNASGSATITVTVNDGQTQNNIVTRTFTVTVNPVNQPPTLNALGNLVINENAGVQTVSLGGIASGAANEIQTLTVTAVSSNPALISNPAVSYASPNSTGTLTFAPASNASGSATITVTVNDGQTQNNTISRTFTVTVNPVNQPPTLNALGNLVINENAGVQTVSLGGIASGAANEIQTLTVTAVSSNPALIPAPTVGYASPNATGTLTFTPANNASGSATITVTVNDGQTQNNTISRTFTVTVNPVNQPPTLNALGNLTIDENAGGQTVVLGGITSGAANEIQTLTVTAVSSNPALIPAPTVGYASPNSTGTLTFIPANNASGSATITVTVNDGQTQNNIVTRTFTVTVNPVNQPPTLNALGNLTINENAGVQTVSLGGITSGAANEIQTLTVTAVSSNPALISNPAVNYASTSATGTLTFTPANNASGSATITVTVNDGQTQNNTVTRTFTVTVNAVNQPPTLNALTNLVLGANAGLQTVGLGGITSGAANEIQTLTVTAVSSNPALIPNPAVNYASANTTGILTFTPANNASGSATITVTVDDGQTQNNTATQTFTVTVNPVNQPPTLNAPGNLTLDANAGLQTVSLGGITSGAASEIQKLTVTAVSSNPALISNPAVGYASPNSTGTLTFTPANNASGTATITVTVNDGQTQNSTVSRSFTVTVNPVNPAPTLNPISDFYVTKNAAVQTVSLTGITPGPAMISSSVANKKRAPKQTIKITAVSGNTKLLTKPAIRYSSPGSAGTLTFKPVKNATGTTTITVTVNNGAKINNLTQKTFKVTVLATSPPASSLAMPALLKPAAHAGGQFALDIAGSSGVKYIVQASTDMVNWTSVQTNTAPFTFTDTQAGQFSQRFYRTVSAP